MEKIPESIYDTQPSNDFQQYDQTGKLIEQNEYNDERLYEEEEGEEEEEEEEEREEGEEEITTAFEERKQFEDEKSFEDGLGFEVADRRGVMVGHEPGLRSGYLTLCDRSTFVFVF